MKEIRCILCLIKCSKYLYFLKKILCFVTIAVVAVTAISCVSGDSKSLMKKVKGMMQ